MKRKLLKCIYPLVLFSCCFPLGAMGAAGMQDKIVDNEYQALLDLYNSAQGGSWTTHTGWTDGAAATWSGLNLTGVVLDGQGNVITKGHVSQIFLPNNNLRGSIPPTIGAFSSLALLNLAYNHLTGPIPNGLGSLTQLQQLSLQVNQLSGPIPTSIGG